VNTHEVPGHIRAISVQIVSYLLKNPDAKDTKDGVQRWWLDERYSQEYAQEALDWLVQQKWVTVRETGALVPLYGLNKIKLHAIQKFLKTIEKRNESQ